MLTGQNWCCMNGDVSNGAYGLMKVRQKNGKNRICFDYGSKNKAKNGKTL